MVLNLLFLVNFLIIMAVLAHFNRNFCLMHSDEDLMEGGEKLRYFELYLPVIPADLLSKLYII